MNKFATYLFGFYCDFMPPFTQDGHIISLKYCNRHKIMI